MAYGVVTHVAAPIEAYDAAHARFLAAASDGSMESLLMHVGCPEVSGDRGLGVERGVRPHQS